MGWWTMSTDARIQKVIMGLGCIQFRTLAEERNLSSGTVVNGTIWRLQSGSVRLDQDAQIPQNRLGGNPGMPLRLTVSPPHVGMMIARLCVRKPVRGIEW